MKTSISNFLIRKISAGINWRYASRHFGKAFCILTLACVSCTANLSAPAMLPVTGAEAKIAFSPKQVDFGILTLGTSSAAQTVTIRNDESTPLLIDEISAPTGFSITANSCPQPPKTLASQGTSAVEVIFAPGLSGAWTEYLQVITDTQFEASMGVKGSARSDMDGMAFVSP